MKKSNFLKYGLFTLIILASVPPSWGMTTHFFVDRNIVSSGNGLTETTAWKYLWNINWTTVTAAIIASSPGDVVYVHLRKGTTWTDDYLNVGSDGTADVALVIDGDYWGTGSFACVDNWYTLTGWAGPDGNGVYSVGWAYTTPVQIFEDSKDVAGLMEKGVSAETLTAGQWYFAVSVVYYKPSSGVAGDHDVYIWKKNNSITLLGDDYVTIRSLVVKGANSSGIAISDSDYARVEGCYITENASGINVKDDSQHATIGGSVDARNYIYDNYNSGGIYNLTGADYTTISYNKVYNNGNECFNGGDRGGIMSGGDAGDAGGSYHTIEYNELWNNGPIVCDTTHDPAIELYKTTNSVIRGNYVHDNYGGGIGVDTVSDNSQVVQNLIVGNGRNTSVTTTAFLGDIHLGTSTGLIAINNSCYNNSNVNGNKTNSSLYLHGSDVYDWIIKNNIFAAPSQYCVYCDGGTWTATSIDNNLYYKDGVETIFRYDSSDHTFTDWRGLGRDAKSPMPANPLFLSTSTGDYRLCTSSPAIDAGVDVGLTSDYAGNKVPICKAPDIGPLEALYQGLGEIGWCGH